MSPKCENDTIFEKYSVGSSFYRKQLKFNRRCAWYSAFDARAKSITLCRAQGNQLKLPFRRSMFFDCISDNLAFIMKMTDHFPICINLQFCWHRNILHFHSFASGRMAFTRCLFVQYSFDSYRLTFHEYALQSSSSVALWAVISSFLIGRRSINELTPKVS